MINVQALSKRRLQQQKNFRPDLLRLPGRSEAATLGNKKVRLIDNTTRGV